MKWNKAKLCFLISAILSAVFLVKNPLDYLTWSTTLNSAPFWVNILVNAICFLIPALITLILGLVFRKK